MFKIGKKNSIQRLIQWNGLFYISIFVLMMGLSGVYLYNLQKDRANEKIIQTARQVREQLNVEFQFVQKNLITLKRATEIFDLNSTQRGLQLYSDIAAAALSLKRVQYNSYFAFEKEWSRKYFHENGFILTVHRDISLFKTSGYIDRNSFVREQFIGSDFQENPEEVWYHIAKLSKNIEFTDIYFDKTYMKKWMVSAGLGIYDQNGKFQGMVGIDILLDELAFQLEKIRLGSSGGVILVDTRSNRILTRTNSDANAFVKINERYDHPSMDEHRYKKWVQLIDSEREIAYFEGDNGLNYIVSVALLPNMPWAVVSFQEIKEAYSPVLFQIGIILTIGLSGLAGLSLLSWKFNRIIRAPVDSLTNSLFENILAARKSRTMDVTVSPTGYLETQRISRLIGVLIRTINIQTQKHIKDLEIQRSKALHSARMASVGQMAGNVAHEINSPLAALTLHAELLKKDLEKAFPADSASLTRISGIIKIAIRIAHIVRGFLVISREGRFDPIGTYPLKQILQDTLDLCQTRFKSNKVSLEVEPIPDVLVKCRAVQISQVLLNLLNNAYDAIESLDEKWIRVGFQIEKLKAVVIITDSGRGISKDIADRMMEPFFTTKDINKGTGLGLSISKSILEEHGGRLIYDFQSVHTKFLIEIPTVE